jgi:hypothetical protein
MFDGGWSSPQRRSLLLPAPQGTIASKGKGIMAMDESNATCGKRLTPSASRIDRGEPP